MDANRRDSLKDRSWMNYKNASDRRKPEYVDGVNAFLDFAFSNAGYNGKIRCPCVSCYLGSFHDRKVVFYHLLARGIINDYNPWTQHGEDENEDESIPSEIHMPLTYEAHPSNPCIEHNVSGSHEEIVAGGGILQGEKENQDVHQESDEDGGGDSPVLSPNGPNVGKYVNDTGTLNTDAGGDVHQENDDEDGDDDYGDQDVSVGEDDNFVGVDNCDSSPNQSCDDADVAATEDEQVVADAYPSEIAQEINTGNRKQSNVRRRGPRGLKRKKEMEKSSERVKVELPANVGRVVGSNARQFVVEAGWLLKQTLPPNAVKWKDLNPNDVAKLLEKVKNRFIFPDESHVDAALLWQFKQWYRVWRSDLRRVYFNKYETYEEQLANHPPYIEEDQWKWLVDYWSSEKFKNLSAINSKVRSSQTTISCVGPTTIARLAYELEMNQSQPDSDQSPVYLKLFEKQKRRNDGTWVDKEAEDGYTKLVKLHKNQVKDNGIDNLSPSEAYAKVFGKAKSINLIGHGENPIALGGSGSKWKRTSCSDQRIIEATVRARVETQSEQKSDDEEALIEQTQSDRQLHTKMREQIRLIRKGLDSSSSNSRIKHNVRGSHEEKVGGGDIHQGEKGNRDVLQENNEASIEKTESDRQLHTKMREQIRLIREGLVSSSANPRIEHNVGGSHEEKVGSGDIHQGEKEDRDVHQENNEDGGGDSPVIPSNVWKYINAIGMSKTDAGGDAHQGNDGDDDNGDQDVSIGEDDNFVSVNSEYPGRDEVIEGASCFQLEASFAPVTDCDSSPNRSCDDAEAEQVAADGYSSEAAPAPNSGDRNQSNVRRRGPRGLKRKKEMEKSSERVKVELPAKVGRVVGSNARQFVVEAGWLLKQTLPPNAVKWKDLNPNDVAKLLEKVKNRFIFPDESHVDAALLWQFKQWYRVWRSDLRRVYFNKYETYEEQLANRPPYIKEDQWKWLVDYWSSEKFKNLSAINSKIRNSQPAIACVGQTSIARLAYELEMNQSQPDSDQSPVYLKLFEKQKKRNDGTWIEKEAEDGYTKLLNLHKKQIEDHGIDNLTPSEAYAKVFSKARSINLLGLGENPVALRGSSSKRKRKGCSDESVIEATLRARVESRSEQKSNDDAEEEAQIEQTPQSDRQLRAKMREQIRLIWQGLASSSSNA